VRPTDIGWLGTEVAVNPIRLIGTAMVNGSEFEAGAPVFAIVTCAVPGLVNKLGGIVACKSAEFWNDVTKAVETPPAVHITRDTPLKKLLPAACTCMALEPGGAVLGESEVKAAVGAVIVKVSAFDEEPVGVLTVICAVPGLVNKFAGMVACKRVAL
jgi:hypothetical protein